MVVIQVIKIQIVIMIISSNVKDRGWGLLVNIIVLYLGLRGWVDKVIIVVWW